MIHPTAIIEPGATLGAGCIVHAYAVITRHCVLGDGVVVHPFAVLGGDPQDLGFDTSRATGVTIGARTVIREHVTINRATKPGGATEIGSDCFLMSSSHVAHDGRLGERVILANAVLLAGHVEVGARAFFGGGAAVHQFVRIGESVMIGGHASITRDVAPFIMASERDEVAGLNIVGLRRRGAAATAVSELKRAYAEVSRAYRQAQGAGGRGARLRPLHERRGASLPALLRVRQAWLHPPAAPARGRRQRGRAGGVSRAGVVTGPGPRRAAWRGLPRRCWRCRAAAPPAPSARGLHRRQPDQAARLNRRRTARLL